MNIAYKVNDDAQGLDLRELRGFALKHIDSRANGMDDIVRRWKRAVQRIIGEAHRKIYKVP